MALRRPHSPSAASIEAPIRPRPRELDDAASVQASPARELQRELANSFLIHAPELAPRWPGAVRVAVIGGGSAALWAAIFAVAKLVL